jgi:hypothetical protein
MKTPMFLTMALIALVAAEGLAQQEGAQSPARQQQAGSLDDRFDLHFKGGTINDLLASIEKQIGARPNVIASSDALALRLAPFTLRSVTARELFMALDSQALFSGPNACVLKVQANVSVITLSIMSLGRSGAKASRRSDPTKVWVTRVFGISDVLTEKCRVEDVVTALETAMNLDSEETGRTVKYHQDTGLLIIRARMKDMDLVESILSELRRAGAGRAHRASARDLRQQNVKLRERIRHLEDEIASLKKSLAKRSRSR